MRVLFLFMARILVEIDNRKYNLLISSTGNLHHADHHRIRRTIPKHAQNERVRAGRLEQHALYMLQPATRQSAWERTIQWYTLLQTLISGERRA